MPVNNYRRPRVLLRTLQLFLLLAFVSAVVLFAQEPNASPSPSPSPSADETRYLEMKRQLERELEIANLQKQIAESRNAALSALPTPRATPGSANTVTNENILTNILVYAELERALANIAVSVKGSVEPNATIVISDRNSLADWMFYRRSVPLFKVVMDELSADYCRIASRKDPKRIDRNFAGLSSTLVRSGNVVGQFADLVSYFRTETNITSANVTIDETVAVSALFPKLANGSGLTVYYPKSFGIDSPMFCGTETGLRPCCVPTLTDDCRDSRPRYCSEVARSFDQLYRSRQAAFESRPDMDNLKKLEAHFQEFLKFFVNEAPANTETVLKKYINAEQLSTAVDKGNTYFLEVVAIKANGTTRVRKNLFFLSDKVDYAGGVVIQWTLVDSSGRLKNSGVESTFRGYLKPQQFEQKIP